MTSTAACALLALSAFAGRTGTGDPAELFRDQDPDAALALHGQLRLRTALYNNLDLDRGAAPTTGLPLFDDGTVLGGDSRLRIDPSFYIGDELRAFVDVDVANASLGPAPDGVPFTASKNASALRFFDVRAAGIEWLLPIGVVSIGRMPSHFALGIAANDGAALDDDGGDRADRIAVVMPLFGHLGAVAFDVLDHALDPQASTIVSSQIGEQAITVGVMKWRAPWEVEMYAKAGRPVFDYGLALSYEWEAKNAPGLAYYLDQAGASLANAQAPFASAQNATGPVVRRDAHLAVADAWARFVVDDVRFEGEGFVSDLRIDDPSVIPGLVVRTPIVGNPAAFALIADARIADDAADPDAPRLGLDTSSNAKGARATSGVHAQLEIGAASADPAPGFPFPQPPGTAGTQPATTGAIGGDVFGPQVDLKRGGDDRFDSARIHPLHRIDLILWRTLLGGVSEAAYARARVEGSPLPWLRLDGNVVYSHAIVADSAPGGAAPLGVEVDVGAEAFADSFVPGTSLRVDAANLVPLGGLGVRGGNPTSISSWGQMVLVRLGYAL